MSAETTPLLVDDLIENSLQYLSDMSGQKGIEIIHKATKDLYVLADPNMMLLVINNLLTNAIKFTPEGGEIRISSKIGEGYVEVAIRDSGIGIPKDLMEELNKGKVLSQAGTGGEKGSGIGLLLTLELMALQGGRITAEANDEKGSLFRVFLPISE